MEAAIVSPEIQPRPRMLFLDNLKVLLTVLVILHHVGQAYGPGGWWYFTEPDRSPWLGIFFYINETFFMCLFFFLSAYFMPGSYERKGPWAFLRDRLVRLGIPLAAFTLLIQPLQMYASYLRFRGGTAGYWEYLTHLYLGFGARPANWSGPVWPDIQLGHLWFLEHLLIYALIYAAWRILWRRPSPTSGVRPRPVPGGRAIFGLVLALAVACFVVRIWYPVQWEKTLFIIQWQRGRLPQYITWVVLGTLAYRQNWLATLPKRTGFAWLWAAGGAIIISVVYTVLGIRLGPVGQRALDALWENLIGISLIVGLLTLFRERWNTQGRLARALADSAFGAYIFHVPVVVLVQFGLGGLALDPLVKFAVASAIAVPATFLVSHAVRRLPGARSIL